MNARSQNDNVEVEVAHEALINDWTRLKEWLAEARDAARLIDRIRFGEQIYERNPRPENLVLRGSVLAEALELRNRKPPKLSGQESDYVEECQKAEETRKQEQEENLRLREQTQTRDKVERFRAEAESAKALLRLDPARALAMAVAVNGANVAELDGEPLAVVQGCLFEAVRAAKERRVLEKHEHTVTSVAIHPNAGSIVSGARDGKVLLWSAHEEREPSQLGSHSDAVFSVAFSLDGERVASAGGDGTVKVMDSSAHGTVAPSVKLTEDQILDVAFADNSTIVAGCGDAKLWMWSFANDERTSVECSSYVASVAVNGSQQTIAAGCGDGVLRILDRTMSEVGRVDAHLDFISSVAFAPQGNLVATYGGDKCIRIWDTVKLELKREIPMASGLVTSLAFSPEGSVLASADDEGSVLLWDMCGELIHSPLICGDAVACVAISSDARFIAGGTSRSVRVWDWLPHLPRGRSSPNLVRQWDRNGDQITRSMMCDKFVADTEFLANGEGVISVGGGGTLRIWELDGRERVGVAEAHDNDVMAVARSKRGFPIIATGGRDNLIRLFDERGQIFMSRFAEHDDDVMSLTFHPKKDILASGSRDGTVQLWSFDGKRVARQSFGDCEIQAVGFHPNGELLACCGTDGTLHLWTVEGVRTVTKLHGHSGMVWDLAFSADGELLASCGSDQTLRIWGCDGSQISRFIGHTKCVRAVRFHPNGRLIATAGEDGQILLWDRDAGLLTRPMEGHDKAIFTLSVSPDGRFLASGGEDCSVRLWRFGDWRAWQSVARERLALHPVLKDTNDEVGKSATNAWKAITGG